jgi:hypothetical protein
MVKRYFTATYFFLEVMNAQMVIPLLPSVIARMGVDVSSINNPLVSTFFKMEKKSWLLFFLFLFIHPLSYSSMVVSANFTHMIADIGRVLHKYD